MLPKAVIIALTTTLAVAAPAPLETAAQNAAAEPAQLASDVASRGVPGVALKACYWSQDCTGSVVPFSDKDDRTDVSPEEPLEYTIQASPDRGFSCRFDTWNDWRGEFEIGHRGGGGFKGSDVYYQDSEKVPSPGWGSTCVPIRYDLNVYNVQMKVKVTRW
ncbi:hypothetical protein Q8F55_007389 [Vanrija albida]|uniref:Uncharacterized protein n=1 Tax=Vanrija albida TaxID=181172 RepID=A0ABR3PTE2_9TREE